jgi:hypothetical protein
LESSLEALHTNCPDPRFILCPGDFLGHDFTKKCGTNFKVRDFSIKVEKFVASRFREHFKGVRIFPVLGNDDSDNGDYHPPSTEFLTNFAADWKDLVGGADQGVSGKFAQSFSTNGYYEVSLPGLPVQMLALNTDLMSPIFKGGASTQDAKTQWNWIRTRVTELGKSNIWLLFHIPPGLDGHAFLTNSEAKDPIRDWTPGAQEEFTSLLTQHSNVRMSFCGHTHRDEFRRLYFNGDLVHLVHVAPSVSRDKHNNPAFQVYTLNEAGDLGRCTTFYYTDGARWGNSYQSPVDPPAVYDATKRKDFIDHYDARSHSDQPLLSANFMDYIYRVTALRMK